MKKGLLSILAVGLMATAANAAQLSLRFAGGATEVTMAGPSDSATIEVLLTFTAPNDNGKTPSSTSGINARFEVGDLLPGTGGSYILDGSNKFVVTETTTPIAGWTTSASGGPGTTFNGEYFFAAEDPTGVVRVSGAPAREVVLGSFTIHKATAGDLGDTFIAFRVGAALPAVSDGGAAWGSRWQYNTTIARNQWLMNSGTGAGSTSLPGNPGDAGPQWGFHGYESLNPLIIHNVPEPSALALLALGGLAMLRRRK